MSSPRISIITATYNRSNVLRYSIASVLASTFADWEMIIVGDACTDDTAAVVASFADPRIRFVNLESNSGDQAVPNNTGVQLARGDFIAFLNHDDLWTPQHLQICLDAIGSGDFVATIGIAIDAHGLASLTGVCPKRVYEPHIAIPASTWLFRRELFEVMGPWHPARALHCSPSQEWLFRAHRKQRLLRSVPQVTTLLLYSGLREQSYARRLFEENARWAERLRDDPTLIPSVLQSIAIRLSARETGMDVLPHLLLALKGAARRAISAARLHPTSIRHRVRYLRKGGFVNALRRNRGLPPLPRRGTT